jgi:hypothetical protein
LAAFPQQRSYVEAACAAVRRAGGVAVDMADFGARDQRSAPVCRAEVAGCDVYLGLVGFRYGTPVPGADDELSFTEFEFDVASEAGLPRLVFLLDEATVPVAQADVDRSRVGRFRRRLQDERVTVTVANPDDLAARVAEGLATLTRSSIGTHRGRGPEVFAPLPNRTWILPNGPRPKCRSATSSMEDSSARTPARYKVRYRA